jgi:predicted acylesterase/phospholipase RssA
MSSVLAPHLLLKAAAFSILSAVVTACATPRGQFSATQAVSAQPPGFSHIREFADSAGATFAMDPAKVNSKEDFVFLALSGGGADGAFGAGVRNGWSTTHQRPQFNVVSGASTGALMAPFAFLGPDYDVSIKEIYTGGHAEQLVKAASVTNVIFNAGLITENSAYRIISQYVTPRLLADIAREHRKGRRLYVVTTNLDAQRPVLWDMGAIAASGRPNAAALFTEVITASASFPGAFSPVLINVEADGQQLTEMHVDGETTDPIFVAPEKILKSLAITRSGSVHKTIYVLINTKLEPSFEVTENTPVQVPGRAIFTLTKTERRNSVLTAYDFARRNGFKFGLAYLPKDIPDKGSVEFETGYMRSCSHTDTSLADPVKCGSHRPQSYIDKRLAAGPPRPNPCNSASQNNASADKSGCR